jgi:putative peptidoglycan lipid II flippase
LFGENRRDEFARMVNTSVYRAAALGMMASAWMAATALPVVDLVYRRGRFQFSDSQDTAIYFFWFALSLAFWVAQSLYSRGFYAAGDTMTPMLASTVITVASLWLYAAMFRKFGVQGLAIASGIGIVVNTLTMALLLNRKRLVPLSGMYWLGLGKAFLAAVLSGGAAWYASGYIRVTGGRKEELLAIGIATLVWGVVGAGVLWITRSDLPRLILARAGFSPAQVARDETREMQKP